RSQIRLRGGSEIVASPTPIGIDRFRVRARHCREGGMTFGRARAHRRVGLRAAVSLFLLLLFSSAPRARAACPDQPLDCFAAAGDFLLVTEGKVGLLAQHLAEFGSSYWASTDVTG